MRRRDVEADRARPRLQRAAALVEGEERRVLAAPRGRDGVGQRHRRLADARRADQQGVGAALQAAAQQLVELGVAARRVVAGERGVMLGRHQARKDLQPAALDREIVKAAAELRCRAS